MKARNFFNLTKFVETALFAQYFLVGFAIMIIMFSAHRIFVALSLSFENLLSDNFLLFNGLAIVSGALTLMFVFRDSEDSLHFAHLPLLFHYALIFTVNNSVELKWSTATTPSNSKNTGAFPQNQQQQQQQILLRFEFYRQTNRVQLWAYALDAFEAKRKFLQSTNGNSMEYNQRRVQNGNNKEKNMFGACLALANPNFVYDFEDDIRTSDEADDANNSIQLILDNDNCYYYLRVNANNFGVTNTRNIVNSGSIVERIWYYLRGIVCVLFIVAACMSTQIFWKTFVLQYIERRKLRHQSVVEARRLEEKLRNCNSFFSIETALAHSISTTSAMDDEVDSYHNKFHFSEII